MTARRLRLVFLGTDGPLSIAALAAVASEHEVVGVIHPPSGSSRRPRQSLARAARLLLGRVDASLDRVARELGAPVWIARSGSDLEIEAAVRRTRPDLLCIAGYPWLLRGPIITLAPMGSVNLHGSLLPRHRGVLPLFWIYYHDDRETGVTVHRVTERADAGDILGQDRFPLPRGFPVEQLNRLNAERGAAVLRRAVRELAEGSTTATPQTDALATDAPRIRPGSAMVDFAAWDVERVWHFLAGLFPRFREPLRTPDGRPVYYWGVIGYRRAPVLGPLGSVSRVQGGWDLHCSGGQVHLRARPPFTMTRADR